MSLVARLVHDISGSRAADGLAYQQDDAVCVEQVYESGLRGHVHGSRVKSYDVVLHWPVTTAGERLNTACSCPNFADGHICKHIWATLYEVDAETPGLVPGSGQLKIERDPSLLRLAVRRRALGARVDAEDLEARSDAARAVNAALTATSRRGRPRQPGPGRGRVARESAAEIDASGVEPVPSWKSDLLSLRARSDLRSRALAERYAARAAEDVLWYLVDLEATRQKGSLIVTLARRRRRRDGTHDLRLVRDQGQILKSLQDPVDREIVALLQGMQPAPAPQRLYDYGPPNPSAYPIDLDLAPEFLPRLLGTNRVAIVDGEPDTEIGFDRPLRWDDGPAWSLHLEIAQPRGRKMWVLIGALVRGEERIDVEEPLVLLASGIMLRRDTAARLDERTRAAFDWIVLLRAKSRLAVPLQDRDRLVETLAALPQLPPVVWPEGFEWQMRDGEPRPLVEITAPGTATATIVRGSVMLDYDGRRADPRRDDPAVVNAETRTWLRRDRAREHALRVDLEGLDLPGVQFASFDPWELRIPKRNLPEVVRKLRDAGWMVEAEGQLLRYASSWSFSVTSGIDWFDVEGRCDFDGTPVALPELLAAARRRETFVALGDGSLAMLPEEWLARFAPLVELGEAQGDRVRFVRSQAVLLDALLAEQEATVDVDTRFAELRDRLHSFDGVRPREAPAQFQGQLRDYQRIGLGWLGFLREFGLGGCLADDMGLGKTVQVLALLEHVRQETEAGAARRPSLAVVPRSLVYNWIAEAARFTPALRVLDYTGLDRHARRDEIEAADLVITTYGTLRRDIVRLRDLEFEYAILDESQAIKNAASESAKACRLLHARHRLALTGTPIENHLGELWSLFEFLNPGMLGRAAAFRGVSVEGSGGADTGWLARALRPYMLRRTKERVLTELPAKTEQTLHCEMDRKQRRLYDELREHYRAALGRRIETEGLARSKIHVLEALLRLRQVACHPGLIDPRRAGEPSAKLEALLAQLDEVLSEGHKALVFSQFTKLLAIVRRQLDERGIAYEYLDGRTRDRAARVEHFQEDSACGVFLVSLKAGGQGLNLTAADYVFLLDPWWNPAVEAQAIDRTHRIGQTRRVFAYRLLCKDTVEEKIEQLQERKRGLAAAVLSDDASFLRKLTAEDLRMLLG